MFDRWKSPDNEFRKSEFKLTEIPTIVDYGTVSTVCLASDNVLDLEKFSIEIFNFQYVVKQKPSNHSVQPQVTKTILWTNQYTFRKLNAHGQCKARENMLSLFTLVCFYFRLDNKVESFKLIT